MILERISDETGLNLHTLARIVASANHRYKVYHIPKRQRGLRRIQHPSRELKFIQRWISYNVLSKLPVHEAATAYREAINVRHVASMHRRNNFLMILDFANFFESINQKNVYDVLQKNWHLLDPTLDAEDYRVISRVATKDNRLTIGAPSSPWLSNAIMYDFDVTVSQICNQVGVAYSRYADEMHFSTDAPGVLTQVASTVRGELERFQRPNLILNERKTVFTRENIKEWWLD